LFGTRKSWYALETATDLILYYGYSNITCRNGIYKTIGENVTKLDNLSQLKVSFIGLRASFRKHRTTKL
jgi:hypothetical protein